MTKVNQTDATKELVRETGELLQRTKDARGAADDLLRQLRGLESRYERERKAEERQRQQEEQHRMQAVQSQAYTAESGLVSREEAPEVVDVTPAVPAAAPVAAPAEEVPAASAAPEAAEKPAPEAPAAAAPAAETAAPKEKPAAETAAPADKPAQEEKKTVAEERPARKPAPRPEQPRRPAIGQVIARPGDAMQQPQRPVGLAPNVIKPPSRTAQPVRPAAPFGGPQQGQRRPAPQGQPYGRAPGAPQGPRPVGGQPYGRPAGAQGPRPMGGQPFNRAPGAPGGRPPMGGAPRPGGNFAGGAGRPQTGRPPMGGRSRGPELAPTVEKERVSNYDPNKRAYQRQHDPERVARNRKQEARANGFSSGLDDEVIRGGKRARRKQSVQQSMAPIKIETAYMSGDAITVRDLTERIGKTAGEIIKKLMILGNMATINSEIDFDTAFLVASEFGVTLERKAERTAEDQLVEEQVEDNEENLRPRPPVVTIMGHVDHGKTSLLDYIRSTRVTAGEAGGITQHIGAYMVDVNGRKITFLDTPGHEAFTAMRARGAQVTDIAVLVVAADDSVMPQTVEAINHAKAADVPLIVAINKMDKPAANPDRVKQDLTQYGVVCEEWGGDAICVPVSAVTGQGVDELLEMILLQADTMDLRANPDRLGRGVIVEAKLDKARGPLATVLLQNGTLHVGDNIIAGMASGRVRALINDRGEKVKEAGPSTPVEIMGFDEVPDAGDEMIAVGDDHLSRQVADERREKLRAARESSASKISMENLFSTMEAGKVTTLNLIIKADVQGSVQAVKQAMEKLSTDEVKVRVLHAAAGAITKDDVNLAAAFNAIIIGFNIRPDASARAQAEKEKVDVRLYTIIYKAIEDMELALKGMLEPEYREVLLGHAEVRNVFKITGAGIIAGCYVTDGKVQRNAQVRLLRDNVVVHEGKLSSLRHLKDDVREMAAGYECGMSLEGHNDIKVGDVVECFIMEEIPR